MENTQDTNLESNAVLEGMMAEVKEHASETGVGTVVSKGEDGMPPMIISSVTGGGKVKVYDTLTGEMSWVLYNKDTGGMLRGILAQKRADGTRMYTLNKPAFEPVRGVYQCLLHKDNPNRSHYTEMGLPVCKKSNITAPYMVEQHMRNRHPSAWRIIERERTDREKLDDREFQRGIIEMAAGRRVEEPVIELPVEDKPPLYVSNKDKAKQKTE